MSAPIYETYICKPPISSARIVMHGNHAIVRIWVNGGLAGELAMSFDEARELVSMIEHPAGIAIAHPTTPEAKP